VEGIRKRHEHERKTGRRVVGVSKRARDDSDIASRRESQGGRR